MQEYTVSKSNLQKLMWWKQVKNACFHVIMWVNFYMQIIQKIREKKM